MYRFHAIDGNGLKYEILAETDDEAYGKIQKLHEKPFMVKDIRIEKVVEVDPMTPLDN